jgi:hypothetical protein
MCNNTAKPSAKKELSLGFMGLRRKAKKLSSAAGRKFYIPWKNRHSSRMVIQDKL